ncbi:MAG: PD-(D/E)XK nuclease family protein [Magnetococcales bacterium]|nr:PD-(D/E)XK nuclease family protein [Magnetococcales bacterium]
MIVTVNRRLSRWLHQRHLQRQLRLGMQAWPTPTLLPYTTWLEQSWERLWEQAEVLACVEPLLLLNEQQQRLLWQQIIASTITVEQQPLFRVAAATHDVQRAWRLLCDARMELTEADVFGHEDATAFYHWQRQFRHQCQQQRWIDHGQLPEWLWRYADVVPWPETMTWVGFDRLTPMQQALVERLQQVGVDVRLAATLGELDEFDKEDRNDFPPPPLRMQLWPLADVDSEARCCADWALNYVKSHPHHAVAVVVPDLAEAQQRLVHHFLATFHPHADWPGASSEPRPLFNLSLGSPLTAYPLIDAALALLSLSQEQNSLEDWVVVLRSPFMTGGDQERGQRGLLEADLWQQGYLSLSVEQLQEAAGRCPVLFRQLQMMQSWWQYGSAQPSTWADRCAELLRQLGWPVGDRSLTSHEYQQWQQWREVLTQLSSLDVVQQQPLSRQQAVAWLRRIASEIIFQPELPDGLPVQIIGVLETAGLHFDAVWLMGMSADRWPPPPQPNPFLPIALQRQMATALATREQSLPYAERLTDRLLASADHIIISYPQQRQEQLLWLSPLLEQKATAAAPVTTTPCVAAKPEISMATEIATTRPVVDGSDWVPWAELTTQPRGGVAILQSQALCPFQAFARYRLAAWPMIRPTTPYGFKARGMLLHLAMAQVWGRLQSLAWLRRAVADATLATVIDQALRVALAHQSVRPALNRLPKPLVELERQRLQRLLQQWLAREAQRQIDFTVVAIESERTVSIAGLTLTVRVDRIDQLRDGRLAMIDYKSGSVSCNHWYGDRPRDLQLPFYAVTGPQQEPIGVLLLARVDAKQSRLVGICVAEDPIGAEAGQVEERSTEDWQQQLGDWQATLQQLAAAFCAGDVRVDPIDDTTCNSCRLGPLCRY